MLLIDKMQASFKILEWDSKEVILENMKILKEYYEYVKWNWNSILSHNHNFELQLQLTQIIHLLKNINEQYDLLDHETDEWNKKNIQNNINNLYKYFKEIYDWILVKFNLQEEIEKNILSDNIVKENFFVTKNSILWINNFTIWKNWIHLLYIKIDNWMQFRAFNFTSKTANWNHLSKEWTFCAWNTYSILADLFKTDIPAFLCAFSDILSDVDDWAHHMASPKDFANWKRFYENLIEPDEQNQKYLNSEEYKEDKAYILEAIEQKRKTTKNYLKLTDEELWYYEDQLDWITEWINSY